MPTQDTPSKNCLIYPSNKAPYCDKCFNCNSTQDSIRKTIKTLTENWADETDDWFVDQVLAALLEALPPKKDEALHSGWENSLASEGWNAYRDELIKLLEGEIGAKK